MSTHKAFSASSPRNMHVVDVSTSRPAKSEVLIKVAYTALVPLDFEATDRGFFGPESFPYVPGFSFSGTVEAVGEGVNTVAVGDKVLAFATPNYGSRAKGAQEYALLPAHAVSKIPANITLEEAATVPDNFVTAWWTLSEHLKLPLQPTPTKTRQPFADESFLIYGASSIAGLFMIQVLALSGCTRIIAVASSRNHSLLRSLGATHTVDYREPDWPQRVVAANDGRPVKYAVDIIATEASLRGVAATVDASSTVAIELPIKLGQDKIVSQEGETGAKHAWELPDDKNAFPKSLKLGYVRTFEWDKNEHLKQNLMVKDLPKLLESGAIRPVPKRVIDEPGDDFSARVLAALDLLRNNAVSGYKLLVKM